VRKLFYILLFITSQSVHFVYGQEDSKWLMFRYNIVDGKHGLLGSSLLRYCSFVNVQQNTNSFVLHEYLMSQTDNGKSVYSKYVYRGNYAYTKDSTALELMPNGVEIISRVGNQKIKEEKSFSEHFRWKLFLTPYRLILFDREVESLFGANSFYFSSLVCQILDSEQFYKFDFAYEKWDHGQWKYPPIDSTLLIDTNMYFLEITNLTLDGVEQVERYFYKSDKEEVEVLLFDYIIQPDSLITITSKPISNHALVHKHSLVLQKEGFEVKFIME